MSAIDEQLHPELLKMVDDVFEFDLPLGRMTVDHNSEVMITISKINSINYTFLLSVALQNHIKAYPRFLL